MALQTIYSFLTYPKRHQPGDLVGPGVDIPIGDDKLIRMLRDIFDRAGRDCTVPIMFTSNGQEQGNPVRSEVLALIDAPSLDAAAPLAERLQKSTSGTSGMGLLFICLGEDNGHQRIVISRFPADEGVVAERSEDAELTVHFVEQVFLKSAFAYKAATYLYTGRADDIWTGYVVDRQLNHGSKAVADYWIVDFLMSEFSTTAALGTKRLAVALRDTSVSTGNMTVKREIAAAANLAANIPPRKSMTISDFCDQFHFSPETTEAVLAKVKPPRLINERFRFDPDEFGRHLAYKQIELDNGAVLTAPADRFDNVFRATKHRGASQTFSTTGEIVDEQLRKSK